MRRKRMRSRTGVTLLCALSLLAIWLIGMGTATVAVAELIAQESLDGNKELVQNAYLYGRLNEVYEYGVETPGYVENQLYEALSYLTGKTFYVNEADDSSLSVLRNQPHDMQTAGLIVSADGTVFAQTDDFLYFRYQTEETWDAGLPETTIDGYARVCFDREKLTDTGREMLLSRSGYFDVYLLRLTGRLDGTEFTASTIESIDHETFRDALYSTEPTSQSVDADGNVSTYYEYVISDIVRETELGWQTLYADPSAATAQDIVIYSDYSRIVLYDPGGPVTYRNTAYDTLADLLAAVAPEFEEYNYIGVDGLFRQLTVRAYYVHEPVDTGGDYPEYQLRYRLLAATWFSPMKAAASELRNAYLWTFALLFVLFWALRGALVRDLADPVERAAEGMAEGFRYLGSPEDWSRRYADVYQLYDQYDAARLKMASQRDEVRRLETALEYAKQAEQNRREMTSHIAHELKTPLAVLHSYAEGLSSHIADDKRDHYLAVIQSETERMDVMVLEMLDLSRLEAGRVQIKREEFSLSDLTESVWPRFEKTAENRGLRVTFDLTEPGMVSADRARIEQVVTNFLSNAVRYAAEGGAVAVRVTKSRGRVTFAVENDAEPLSEEALSRVFESFYRADESRSTPGTGLGLALCKRIVALHGGECAVRNTQTGVEFRFTL